MLSVTEKRIKKFFCQLRSANADGGKAMTARQLARLAGSIISMGPALGSIARLRTRGLYRAINSVARLDQAISLHLHTEAISEIKFWSECFHEFHGLPMRPLMPSCSVITWSDASDFAWGGYTVTKSGVCVARGGWPDAVRKLSSTWRELRAAHSVIASLITVLGPGQLIHRTDNQAAALILMHGSRLPHLHSEAVQIFQLCYKHGIQLHAEWLPREENARADLFSKIEDEDDWQLNPVVFSDIDRDWGPHTIDRFSSSSTTQLPRFCSLFWNPGCLVVDAFTTSWSGELNWLCPPPHLIARCIRQLKRDSADGSLLVPLWFSAPWWPLLCLSPNIFCKFVTGARIIYRCQDLFLDGTCRWNLFSSQVPNCDILVLRICCCGQHQLSEPLAPPTPAWHSGGDQ